MACMTANSRGIDGGRVRSVNATPGMRLSSEFNPRKTDRRAFLSLFGLEGLQEEPGLDHVTSRLTESKISEVKTYMSNIRIFWATSRTPKKFWSLHLLFEDILVICHYFTGLKTNEEEIKIAPCLAGP